MKKMILAALMAVMTLTVSAQDYSATLNSVNIESSYRYISPLLLTATEFNLQALKDSSVNEQDYAAALTFLQKRLETEKKEIGEALKTLKTEKSLYDAQSDLYKSRKGQAEAMSKQMDKNIKTYQGYVKSIDKQYDLIKKIDNNTCDAIKGHSRELDRMKRQFEENIDRFKELQRRMEQENSSELSEVFTELNDFLIEVTDKETRLKALQAQNKTNLEIVKGALKAAAAAAKGK